MKHEKVGKRYMELASRKAGLEPAMRGKYGDYQIFIADGYCDNPKIKLQKFGPDEKYYDGAFCTLWFIANEDDVVMFGAAMFEEALANLQYDRETRKEMRLERAMEDAAAALDKMEGQIAFAN